MAIANAEIVMITQIRTTSPIASNANGVVGCRAPRQPESVSLTPAPHIRMAAQAKIAAQNRESPCVGM
jgi:hypothetical protein